MSKKHLKRKVHKIQADSKKELLEQDAYIQELRKRIYHLEKELKIIRDDLCLEVKYVEPDASHPPLGTQVEYKMMFVSHSGDRYKVNVKLTRHAVHAGESYAYLTETLAMSSLTAGPERRIPYKEIGLALERLVHTKKEMVEHEIKLI